MTTTEVENYPGFPDGLTGPELMDRFRDQAKRFGTVFVTEDVKSVQLLSHPFIVKSSSHEIEADAIIIATGATARRLNIAKELATGNFGRRASPLAPFVTERLLFLEIRIYTFSEGGIPPWKKRSF